MAGSAFKVVMGSTFFVKDGGSTVTLNWALWPPSSLWARTVVCPTLRGTSRLSAVTATTVESMLVKREGLVGGVVGSPDQVRGRGIAQVHDHVLGGHVGEGDDEVAEPVHEDAQLATVRSPLGAPRNGILPMARESRCRRSRALTPLRSSSTLSWKLRPGPGYGRELHLKVVMGKHVQLEAGPHHGQVEGVLGPAVRGGDLDAGGAELACGELEAGDAGHSRVQAAQSEVLVGGIGGIPFQVRGHACLRPGLGYLCPALL